MTFKLMLPEKVPGTSLRAHMLRAVTLADADMFNAPAKSISTPVALMLSFELISKMAMVPFACGFAQSCKSSSFDGGGGGATGARPKQVFPDFKTPPFVAAKLNFWFPAFPWQA